MRSHDDTDDGRIKTELIHAALEAARRRRSDEELTVSKLIGYAYHALPPGADLDDVRPVAADLLDGERHPTPAGAGRGEDPLRELATDGGRYYLPGEGDRARDRRDEDSSEVIIVETHPDTAAHDYTIDALDGLTVAEVNEEFDAAAPVVEAVYADEIDAAIENWQNVEDIRNAILLQAVTAYTFPADRLAPVSGGDAA